MSLDVVIWRKFHCEILAWYRQTSFILGQMIVWTTFGAKIWRWISKWNFNFFTWNESWRCKLMKFSSWDFSVKLSDIIYLKSNDCLNHVWCKNLTIILLMTNVIWWFQAKISPWKFCQITTSRLISREKIKISFWNSLSVFRTKRGSNNHLT